MNNSEIINNIDSFSSSVILVLNNNSNPDAIVKSLIEKLATISLHNLQNYLDLIILDGYKKNIKKDDVLSIMKQFSHSNITDNNAKFYYLKNFQYASNEAYNCLLKFIEEPGDNTMGIFTTNSINELPITIVSRCKVFYLEPDGVALEELKKEFKLDKHHWITQLFNDVEALKEFCNSENFIKLKATHDFLMKPNFENYKSQFNEFKNWEFHEIKILIKSLILVGNLSQQNQLLEIMENISVNPVRPLLFLKLYQIMTGL